MLNNTDYIPCSKCWHSALDHKLFASQEDLETNPHAHMWGACKQCKCAKLVESIIPLSKENIEQAVALQNKIFPDEKEGADWLRASLDPEKYKELIESFKPSEFRYWVMMDGDNNVIGLTGLYHRAEDKDPIMAWIGWYGIDPAQRGKGLGEKLLRWTIEKARDEGNKKIKLYTSTSPNEAAAQKLYEKVGLKLVEGKQMPNEKYKTLYREMSL